VEVESWRRWWWSRRFKNLYIIFSLWSNNISNYSRSRGLQDLFHLRLNQVVTELLLYFQQLHQQVVEVELDIQHKHLDQVVQVVELQ
jgi:hypothetical protein